MSDSKPSKEYILDEIRRLALSNNGQPPGIQSFAAKTNILAHHWRGKYWVTWSSALVEAGLQPNPWGQRADLDEILRKIAKITLELGHVPSDPELGLLRQADKNVPTRQIVSTHFKRGDLLRKLRELGEEEPDFAGLLSFVPEPKSLAEQTPVKKNPPKSGWVYLISYGDGKYKIGHSYTPNQRLGNLDRHTPQTLDQVWRIETDDPSGIEKYWKTRFVGQSIKNEFFKLSNSDVTAFKRWRKIY